MNRSPLSASFDLAFERARYGIRVFRNDGQHHLCGLVGTMRALLPIPDSPEREMESLCELLLGQVQLLWGFRMPAPR